MRVTLLDELGNVADQENNYWVTDKLVSIAVNPEVEAGADLTLKGGCDCIIGTYRGPDLFKRHTFEVSIGALEFGMMALMLGATPILEGTDPDDVIGLIGPNQVSCADAPPPNVALEVWSYAWEDDHQNEGLPYIHWLWPLTRWQVGPATLGVDFFQPALTGFSQSNPLWGAGPYDDDPGVDVGDGPYAVWLTDTAPPDAECAYGTITPSS
jgi:hypothetical protein